MFDDVCLYSDLSESLSSCNYRLQARRFLQELFLDISFTEVGCLWIINRKISFLIILMKILNFAMAHPTFLIYRYMKRLSTF